MEFKATESTVYDVSDKIKILSSSDDWHNTFYKNRATISTPVKCHAIVRSDYLNSEIYVYNDDTNETIGFANIAFSTTEPDTCRIMKFDESEFFDNVPIRPYFGLPDTKVVGYDKVKKYCGIMDVMMQLIITECKSRHVHKIYDAMLGHAAPIYRKFGFSASYSKEPTNPYKWLMDGGVAQNQILDDAIISRVYVNFGSFDMCLCI